MKLSRHWLLILLLVPIGLGILRLKFDVDILNLLPAKLPVVQGLRLYQQHFSSARELIITLEAGNAEQAESDARSLAQALRIHTNLISEVIWQPPWMEDPGLITELIAQIWLNQSPLLFGELTNRLAVPNLTNTLQQTLERLATSLSPSDLAIGGYDPYGLARLPAPDIAMPGIGTGEEMFASDDKTFRVLYVEARPDLDDYRACRSWIQNVRTIVSHAHNSGTFSSDTKVQYTGPPAFVAEISTSMQQDMSGASAGTLAVIGLLFWLTHRRILPLIWLLVLLLFILGGTLALGGLVIGTVNIVSIGFASILLGLAEDFGIVIYEESRSHPELSASRLRRAAAPGVWWSTLTTASAFLLLNLSGLPGLGQLGTMVAMGVVLGALVMLYGYAPLLLRFPSGDRNHSNSCGQERFLLFQSSRLLPDTAIWIVTGLVVALSFVLLWVNGIHFDDSPDPLRPRKSAAFETLEKIKTRLTRAEDALWVLVTGKNETEVGKRLDKVGAYLSASVSNRFIAGFTLPTALWPKPENQQSNLPAAAEILKHRQLFRDSAIAAGFNTNALFLTDQTLDIWERALVSNGPLWPTNRASQWLFSKFTAQSSHSFLALGLVQPTTNAAATKQLAANWPVDFQREGLLLSGYSLLGWTVFDLVSRDLPWVVVPVLLLVLVSLWLAFRKLTDVLLSLATLAFSALCLQTIMILLKWDWNLLNLVALPLLLGMGTDFSIHMQLALRRYNGDLLLVRRSMGRALLLAGSTTIAGFISLAFSTNAGMASLGIVCALGIALALLTAVYLLPVWWLSMPQDTPGRAPKVPPLF